MRNSLKLILMTLTLFLLIETAHGDENLFGYIRGTEPLPQGSWDIYEIVTSRTDKGKGTYQAYDSNTELEYGFTDRFTAGFGFMMQSTRIKDLLIDAYIPKDIDSGLNPSGAELFLKYNFLSPAKDNLGLSMYFSLSHSWLDKHSGQKKDATSAELELLLQKYFLEGELIWAGNIGMESTYARRYHIEGLPEDFEWPTFPEMEIGINIGTGLSYRFLPSWFIGGEVKYETEFETEVGQERWSTFAGPSLHYGSEQWWTTLTWFSQIEGGPDYPGQTEARLHLVEKTKQEVRLKVGFNY